MDRNECIHLSFQYFIPFNTCCKGVFSRQLYIHQCPTMLRWYIRDRLLKPVIRHPIHICIYTKVCRSPKLSQNGAHSFCDSSAMAYVSLSLLYRCPRKHICSTSLLKNTCCSFKNRYNASVRTSFIVVSAINSQGEGIDKHI